MFVSLFFLLCCLKTNIVVVYTVCHKLGEYGCNPTSISTFLTTYINNQLPNNTLSTHPCTFDTINASELLREIDPDEEDQRIVSLFNVIIKDSIPCQVWIEKDIFNRFIEPNDLSYLIDYNYWFVDDGSGNGACNTANPAENEHKIEILPCDECSFKYTQGIVYI